MVPNYPIRRILTVIIILQLLLSFIAPGIARAAEVPSTTPLVLRQAGNVPAAAAVAAPQADTTLSVTILTSPWATLDSNDPAGNNPKAFAVEGKVTNTGTFTATNVVVTLNYHEDDVNNWVLLDGEEPVRNIPALAPNESKYVYWLASYSTTIGATHMYSISAYADNAPLVTTSDNSYGNPLPGMTVQTRSTLSTGNSAVDAAYVIQIGVAFTMTVTYDLGTSPLTSAFSPIGNTDFNATAYYLSSATIRFYNDAGTWENFAYEQLYFPALNSLADYADVTFVFTARAPLSTHLCPYNAVTYQSSVKYDQFYCNPYRGTLIPIDGTAKLIMDKQVSSTTAQQGEVLTYTISYTNVGSLPLTYSWIWDDIDPSLVSIITPTISPSPSLTQTTESRVAWYLGTISPAGQPGSSGTLTFSVLVDGNGQDIPDGTLLENIANFGIHQNGFPEFTAITDTVTTTILAPTLSISKTDGQAVAEPGDPLTYLLQVSNNGSVTAAGLVITDVLPADVVLNGTPIPAPDSQIGQTFVWTSLDPLAPGGTLTITIPVTINMLVPNGTVLTNQMQVRYTNPGGHVYDVIETSDTTLVNAPILAVSKSDFPDPVLTGNPLVYTLSYANNGPAEATNVIITDAVPPNTTYDSCSGAACSMSGGVVTWNLGTLPAYTSGTVQFTVIVDAFLPDGSILTNDQYGILSDQTDFLAGEAVQTTVSLKAGNLSGYTFLDANTNGFFDAGESWLTGVPVTLTQDTVTNTLTDAFGYYAFRVEVPGSVEVSAALPAGYFRTTPGNVIIESILGITQTVNFGYALITETFGVIYGTVYQDNDVDGTQDLGEYGLPGVTISSAGAAITPVTTNALGQYTLRYDTAGINTVVETNPPLYVSTTPDSVLVDVVLGSSGPSPVDFGDFLGIMVTGQVFNDTNVNGIKDAGELGLPGALVNAGSASFTTGGSGDYTLFVAVPTANPLDILETDPTGYVSTNAIPGSGVVRIDTNTLRISSPISGTIYSNGDFGDVLASAVVTITGMVWDDNGAGIGGIGGNGLPNGSEPGLTGVLVSLSSGLSQVTAPDGSFLLYAPPAQVITITETNPAGYISTGVVAGTNASNVDFDHIQVIGTLSGGQSSLGNRFGDVRIASGLSLSKQAEDVNGPPLLVDDTIRYTLQVSNTGTNPAFNVVVTDQLPDGLTFVEMLPTMGTVSGPNPVLWSLPVLSPATSETLWITATINLDQSGQTITNTGSLTSSNIITPPLDPPAVCPDGSLALNGECSITPADQSDLLVHKTASPHLVNAGDPLTYTITIINLGPSTASQALVTDTLPADVTLDSYTASQGSYDLVTGLWTVGNLTSGASATLTLFVIVDLDAAGTLLNTAQAASEDYDPDPDNSTFTVQTPIASLADLTINKSDNPDPVAAGGILTYTLDFANQGPSNAQSVVITDDLPLDVTFLGVVSQPGYLSEPSQTGQSLVWTAAALPAGTTGSIVFTVQVHPQAGGTLQNHALLSSATAEVDPGNNEAFESTTIGTSGLATIFGWVYADLNGNGLKDAGEAGLPGVSVILDGVSTTTTDADGLYFFITSVAGLHSVVETDPAGYHSTTPNEVQLNVTLGSSYQVDFGDSLSALTSSIFGTIFNDLNVNGTREPGEPALSGVLVSLAGGLPATYTTNQWGQYTFLVEYTGFFTVTETDNPGWVSTNAIPGSPVVTKLDNNTFRVEITALGLDVDDNLFADALQSAVVTIDGLVWDDNGAGTGGIGGDGLPNGSEPGLPGALVSLSSGMSQVTGSDGTFILYAPPGEVITITETNLSGFISTGAIAGTNASVIDFDHIAVIGTLGGGQSSQNNLFGDVRIASGLELTKQAEDVNGPPLLVDDTIRYTLQVSNTGSNPAFNVTVTDQLPDGLTFVEMLPTMGTVSGPNPVIWSLPVLAPATSETLWITATINLDQSGQTITNTGSVTSTNIVTPPIDPPEVCPDGSLPVNGECPTTPQDQPDLLVTKTASADLVSAGDPLTYTITLTNLGPSTASQALVTDTLPADVTFDSYTTSQGTFDDLTGVWTVGSLGSGASATLTLLVTVNPDAAGTLVNTAQAASEDYDPDLENNTATAQTALDALSDLSISKSDDPDPVAAGGILTYTLVFTNTGPSDAQGLVITDELPLDVTFLGVVSQPGYLSGPSQTGQSLIWTAATLPAGTTGSVVFTVQVHPQAGGTLQNHALLSSATAEADPGDNEAFESTTIGASGQATLFGWVYDDVNGNGVKDTGEAGLPGVLVTLDGLSIATTDADGLYFFITSIAGLHRLVETDPAGYFSTTPNQVHVNVILGNSYRVDFGDAQASSSFATLFGTVFEDLDGDGLWDIDEPGIPGVTITLDGSTTTTTDQYGSYSLYVNTAGVHTVVETDLAGYFSTTPNEVHVLVVLGNGYQVDFGDAPETSSFAVIYGTVFEDTDGDGVWDQDETGIPGVTVTLDGVTEAATNQYGFYTLRVDVAGVHTVVETDLAGYFSITPNEVHVNVELNNSYRVDFGDALNTSQFATIYGTVFEDTDGDGLWDAGEVGLPDVTLTLDGVNTTTTDQYGAYSFYITLPGVHSVVETDPAGYLSTTLNEVHVAVELGNGYQVDFGDVLDTSDFAALYGTVFEDTDADGVWDAGEIGIPGVILTLDGVTTATTNQYGDYTFLVAEAGIHTIVETDLDGYVSTTPNEIQVEVLIGNGYQVDFGDMLLCTCDPDAFEEDDTSATATPIQIDPDARQAHDFCDDSTDWLSFNVQAGGIYTITTSSWGQRADTFLALFDTDGQTLLAANDDYQGAPDYSLQIVWQAPAGGTYYIQVTNRAGLTCCSTDYDVWVEGTVHQFTGQFLPYVVKDYLGVLGQPEVPVLPSLPAPQGVISHMCPDAYEVDDSWELAQPILPGVLQVHSFDSNPALFAADKDVRAFSVRSGDVVTFTVTTLTNTNTLLELFDRHGNALNITGTTQVVWEVPAAGTYILSVAPQTQNYGCVYTAGYELLMEIHQPNRLIIPLLYK